MATLNNQMVIIVFWCLPQFQSDLRGKQLEPTLGPKTQISCGDHQCHPAIGSRGI